MKRPTLFKPTQKDLERVANVISESLSIQKVVIAGTEKIQGKKTK